MGIGDRAGIVHRLDKETSGILVVAKTPSAFVELQRQFKSREVQKGYVALVHRKVSSSHGYIEGEIGRIGKFGKFGIVDAGGRKSLTEYKVRGRYAFDEEWILSRVEDDKGSKARINYLKQQAAEYTLLDVVPKTGRTHQIRVHLKSIGHPLVSDIIYAPGKLLKFDLLWCPRLFLHAAEISFLHPKTKKRVSFKSGLPKELEQALACLTP